jgi:DNA-binding transcriptional regulator LsrR (DeoR family)
MNESKTYTSDELRNILAFTLLRKYYNSDFTLVKLSKHLGLSLSTVNKLIRLAKDDIIIYYNKIKDMI